MIIDAHTHIFPPEIRQSREKFFPSESAFKLLYQSPKARLIGRRELISAMDANRVDRAVVFGFPWTNIELSKTHNDYIMETVLKYPDRFTGLGCFDPASPGAVAEAERCLTVGLGGIGELAFYQSGIDDLALESWHLGYQSRSGPVEWLSPSTPEMMEQLAAEGCRNILMVPISFVSDHVETLYEIDILYREMAENLGMRLERVESLNTRPEFVEAMKDLVTGAAKEKGWL